MDDKTQKERLEQELRFLKESFEAEVISKEEFEKGKNRLEKKLKDIGAGKKYTAAEKEETRADPIKEEPAKEPEKIKLKVIQDEEYFEPIHEVQQKEQAQEMKEPLPQKKESKFFKYAIVFIVLTLVVFFSYSFVKGKKYLGENTPQKFIAACNSDSDCRQDGKKGACLNAGKKNAKCEFKEYPKTNILVLNDRQNCFNCDTQRVLGILESWFGPISAKEINPGTDEGKNISEKVGAKMLPMYILDENITGNSGFEQFKAAFIKKYNYFVLNDNAAGSSFYIKRENIPNKLDLFIISGDDASARAEKNLKEFLDTFPEVKFEKHFSEDSLVKELGIKNFPAFLVNNKDKFTGIQSAEVIKENFCKINKLPECQKSLSKSLV